MRPEVVEKRLASLPELSRQGKRINGLHRLLACPKLWEQAYEAIAPNRGALTPGVEPTTLEGFSLKWMEDIIAKVKDGTYRFKPVRRVYIPKPNGKQRPLGIPSADDKLVQAAVKLVLEQVYEPIFSEASHGFRPGRSCHTALEEIKNTWTGIGWLVDVDVASFFDNIDHGILMDLLRKRVDDEDFLRLIKGMLTTGHLEDWTWHASYSGTPQGGVISPLLANVYLHELDQFIADLASRFDRGKRRRKNLEYLRMTSKVVRLRKRVGKLNEQGRETEARKLLDAIRDLRARMMQIPSTDRGDPGYRRLRYVRYADDFLIGVTGTKAEAREIMDEVRAFLKVTLRLEVADGKSGVSDAADGARFLGYDVLAYTGNRVTRVLAGGRRRVTRRPPSRNIQLHVPADKLAGFVERKRLGNYHTKQGGSRPELTNSSDAEILLSYNVVLRGLAEYYKLGTGWKRSLGRVHYVWWYNLMNTLAAKHKCSVAQVLHRVLTHHRGERGLWITTSRFLPVAALRHIQDQQVNRTVGMDREKDFTFTWARSDVVDRLRSQVCSACGETGVTLEVHHARRLADAVHLSLAAQTRIARTRKRVALCVPCHDALHAGSLTARLDSLKARVGAG